jgi:alkylresorcinol/alkylpyrone synthase
MYVSQEEAFLFYDSHFDLTPQERELYRRVLLDGPIAGRFIGIDEPIEACETDQDKLIERFAKFGRLIGAEAARKALDQAGLAPEEIDGLVVNTCTGYLCPGLSSYVAEDIGLRTDIRFMDLMGMGCGAAVPNWEAAAGMLALSACGPVLSLSVEVCTATIFLGPEPDLIISNSIFGDGAAAAVLDGQDSTGQLCRIVGFSSALHPRHREDLRYRSVGGRLRNSLSRRVPAIGARTAKEAAHTLLKRHGRTQEDIRWWAVHAGGSVVLDQIEKVLGLQGDELRFSREVLRQCGNMSSPTLLFALDKILTDGRPAPGDLGLLIGFGAGFSAFAALVEF